jgi:pimeloyl-ACP methyl ester carboxylesterase
LLLSIIGFRLVEGASERQFTLTILNGKRRTKLLLIRGLMEQFPRLGIAEEALYLARLGGPNGETMKLELISIETSTYPLDGAFYQPEVHTGKGAILIMHGNCGNFYTGVSRHFAPLLAGLGYAVLTYNRRGHDVVTSIAREATGGAFQRIHEMIEDNQQAERWLRTRGYDSPIVIGHSNGGMLAVQHCAGNASVRALVLLSAHKGGKNLFRAISQVGLMAGERFEEFSTHARELVAAGRGNDLMQVPGWWWVISAQSFVDYLDNCPNILDLAPQVRCPVLFLRGDREADDVYPGEAFVRRAGGPAEFALVPDCDHFYRGGEQQAVSLIANWLFRSSIQLEPDRLITADNQ